MRRHPAPWLVAAFAVAGLTAACTRQAEPESDIRPQAENAVEELGTDVQDGWITTKIQAKYFADDEVKGRRIDVTTDNGVVTLTGTVDDESARRQAIDIAKNTDGVVRVEDRLTAGAAAATTGTTTTAAREAGEAVEGTVRGAGEAISNAWITTKIQSQYFADDLVKGRRIDVTTNNGVVTLSGDVRSVQERQQAVQIARQTEGVRRVEDRLMVSAEGGETAATSEAAGTPAQTHDRDLTEQMSDAGITARVQSKFFLDDMVKGRNINVDTSTGVVTLQGEVGSQLEREQAVAIARSVDGVEDVRDQLTVNRAATAERPEGTAAESGIAATIEDSWITTKIQSRYFMDDIVKAGDIDVTTNQGVVTLTGTVPTDEARRRAATLAEQTEGVKRVQNQLTVGTSENTAAAAPATP